MLTKRISLVIVLVMLASALGAMFVPAAATSHGKNVLIYGPSMGQILTPDWTYNEATIASDLGHMVTIADPQTWVGMTEAQFAAFDAIIFGDPKCGVGTLMLEPANFNKAVWSPVVTGPTTVIGTTPQFYQFAPNVEDRELIANGISFALSGPGTGLYVSLACYYVQATPNTPVEFLSQVGGFQVGGRDSCSGSETIVDPDHPAMAGLTSLGQPAVGCASQEFLTAFPPSLSPLATGVRLSSPNVLLPFIVATPPAASNPPADPPGDPPAHSHTLFNGFYVEVEWEDDELEVEGTFTLGEGSDGINPVEEQVIVTIGTYEITIEAGSFSPDDDGEFEFEGIIDGVEVEMEIELEDDNTFEFEIEVEGAGLPELVDPLEVTLVIGDDKGTATANIEHEDDEDDEHESHKEDGDGEEDNEHDEDDEEDEEDDHDEDDEADDEDDED